jgi:hypothetical protein
MDIVGQARKMEGQLHAIKTINNVTYKSPEAQSVITPTIEQASIFEKSLPAVLF